jgi:glycosyltransferase involved in cell wall biosynthesis
MEQIKITSIILARDEETNIARCIDSQKECIDEIIVLIDNRTKDKTPEIVKSKNVLYEMIEWKGYAGTKQYAVSKISNNWILWIDADESLTPELADELKVFKNTFPEFDAYSIKRRAYFLGKWIKHGGWYPAKAIRLFNKDKAKFNENHVHESLEVNGSIGQLKNDLEHWTDPSIKHYFDKFNNYTSLAAEQLNKKNESAGIVDILIRPLVIFCKMYILRFGFLDGVRGLMLAVFSSAYVFTKYCKLWELRKLN